MCRRVAEGTSGPPLAANSEGLSLRPLRPKLSLRSAAAPPAATPELEAPPPVAAPVRTAPVAPPPVAPDQAEAATSAGKQRPNLRLRNAPAEGSAAAANTEGSWQVHFGRQGFVRREEVIRGPFTWEEVCCLVRNGTLMPEHRVRREGDATWQSAKSMPGLFDGWNLKARETRERREAEEKRAQEQEDSGFFAPERKALSWGPMGGIFLMVIAAIWFVAGLYCNRIFFYPPVLFVFGLVGFCKSLGE